ncbi:SOS response-associated peptidase [Paenibacillus terrigena]|uniref:SOS response-associated peptidase n=1 Tax=Paenibacillus terrigena TaxID=369333 RepID=UPI00035E99C0|nr:SOS response-associated peptidase [Paenibacillus terrigena]
MCRRFSLSADLNEVQEYFKIDTVLTYYRKRYNIAPTQDMAIIMREGNERRLDQSRWGLFPFWGKDAINADIDAVHRNPAYPKMIDRRRCIIPCNGFYYWRTVGKRSYPIRVVMKNRGIFGVAGLYENWRDTRGVEVRTCTLLMTNANTTVREFDSRMPAILDEEGMEAWLDPNLRGVNNLRSYLRPHEDTRMDMYPVSPLLANDAFDTMECIQQMDMKMAWVKE